ncbi:hypothetical protein P4O66_010804, partial [Electrophorus voltai]
GWLNEPVATSHFCTHWMGLSSAGLPLQQRPMPGRLRRVGPRAELCPLSDALAGREPPEDPGDQEKPVKVGHLPCEYVAEMEALAGFAWQQLQEDLALFAKPQGILGDKGSLPGAESARCSRHDIMLHLSHSLDLALRSAQMSADGSLTSPLYCSVAGGSNRMQDFEMC